MNKTLAGLALIAIFLIVLIPYASNDPDGLEKTAESMGVTEQEAAWKGLMPDYALSAINNPYLSTLTASILGITIVLLLSIALGKAVDSKKTPATKDTPRN
jgi:hypothetical protein